MNRIAERRSTASPVTWCLCGLVVAAVALTALLPVPVRLPDALAAVVAIWLALCVQALPFLVLGVLVSGAIVAFLPRDVLLRVVPPSQGGAVFAAGLFGTVLPGCECASVPVARALLSRGAPSAAAFTFMLSAPAINPVVLVSTAVAFPGQPMIVIARFLASLLSAWVVGLVWVRIDRRRHAAAGGLPRGWPLADPAAEEPRSNVSRFQVLVASASHDFLHAGGFLVLGTLVAAVLKVAVPAEGMAALAAEPLAAVLAMALLAILLCICSEADAFVAASFTAFSPTAQLVFMTVGPMVDLKLISMQVASFGPAMVLRFVPLTLATAVGVASLVGLVAL